MFSRAARNIVLPKRGLNSRKAEPQNYRRSLRMSAPSTPENNAALLTVELQASTAVLRGRADEPGETYMPGRIHLVLNETLQVDSLEAEVRLQVNHKRPLVKDCSNCSNYRTQLRQWEFIPETATLPEGRHSFDIVFAIPNHLPASTDTPLVEIKYELYAQASRAGREPVIFHQTFEVQRSLKPLLNVPLHNCDFSSTNIHATLSLGDIIQPIGTHPVHLRLDNIASRIDVGFQVWKLKKLKWKLEECITAIFPTCQKQAAKEVPSNDDNNSKLHSETRLLGKKSLSNGWKEHHNDLDSHITCDFDYSLNIPSRKVFGMGYVCDEQAGPEINHHLKIELTVEKYLVLLGSALLPEQPLAIPRSPWFATPARLTMSLRMTRPVVLTELLEPREGRDTVGPPAYYNLGDPPPTYSDSSEITEL